MKALAVSLIALLFALLPPARAAGAPLRVVASTPDLAALAKEIGGDRVSVRSLALPTQDPHFVDAKPSLAIELNRADLLLVVGLDLEVGWLPTLLVGARNAKVQPGSAGYLDCSQFVDVEDVHKAPVDRSQGDIHPTGNPHYTTDPRAAAAVARGIATRLGQVDPGGRAAYEANHERFARRLAEAQKGWEKRLGAARGAPVITYHKTLTYLVSWLGLVEIGQLEPKPGTPPSPRHIASLLELGRARKARAIVQEAYYPDNTAKVIAARLPAALVRLPGATDVARGETYVAHMEAIVVALERGLGAKAAAP
jgi:zinc/manganese transport system substrate-binding protein